jgi:hypothetical protein
MKAKSILILLTALIFLAFACSTAYKAKPLPFKLPASYGNAVEVGGAWVGAEAFADSKKAEEAFGFNIRGAGMLPVQVVFDNQGSNTFKIRAEQTFLEDEIGNLWPILADQTAYERATRYAQTKQIFKEGAYAGFLGATAGAIIGAAIGVVAGENVAVAAGKGAAVGAAAGATLGGVKGYTEDEARRAIIDDLNYKSLGNRPISPQTLAYGFIFFPGEARSARQLRLQLIEVGTSKIHVLQMKF